MLELMTSLKILAGSKVYLPLRVSDVVIKLAFGNIELGMSNAYKYKNEYTSYLDEPTNKNEILNHIKRYIVEEMPLLFEKSILFLYYAPPKYLRYFCGKILPLVNCNIT